MEQLVDLIINNAANAYLGVFVLLLLCGFGLPIPEDTILITGGILAAAAGQHFVPMTIVAFFGVLIGDCTVYCAGRFGNQRIRRIWPFSRVFKSTLSHRIEDAFRKRGEAIIFVARFLPGLRMPIFVTAGVYQIRFRTFLLYDGTAAIISIPLFVWLGFLFAENLERLQAILTTSKHGILIAILGVLVIVGFFFLAKKFKKRLAI